MAKILLIHSGEHFSQLLRKQLADHEIVLVQASSLQEGLNICRSGNFKLVIIEDVAVASNTGVLTEFRRSAGQPEVMVVAKETDPLFGELMLLEGAINYLDEEASPKFASILLGQKGLQRNNQNAEPEGPEQFGIFGQSSALHECFATVAQLRHSTINVFIFGETGTGKELFARAIHHLSPRKNGPLVTVDCASLPEPLVESLLFGHTKGSFTGADQNRTGLIKRADGGTLFLDEVGELPMSVQKRFLRVLQERRFTPVGANREESSNFRVVAATNKDLEGLVAKGKFRRDLLYRLRGMTLQLPPLRNRGNDVNMIAENLMAERCKAAGLAPKRLSSGLKQRFKKYSWPGNVRELVNIIDSIIAITGTEETVFVEDLPANIHARMVRSYYTKDGAIPPSSTLEKSAEIVKEAQISANAQACKEATSEEQPQDAAKTTTPSTISGSEGLNHPLQPQTQNPVQNSAQNRTQANFPSSLPDRPASPLSAGSEMLSNGRIPPFKHFKKSVNNMLEREYLKALREMCESDINEACNLSDLSRARLYELLRKHGFVGIGLNR